VCSSDLARFEALKANKTQIETDFGSPLQWHFPEDNKQGAIRFIAPANFEDESKWDGYYDWYVSNMEKLRAAMEPYLKDLREL
jgi:hypothetical protein